MWREEDVVREDLDRICGATCVPWQELDGRTVLVTGATGLVGSHLVRSLLWSSRSRDAGVRVVAVVRDRAKAERRFAAPLADGAPLTLLDGDVVDFDAGDGPVHHVVHAAAVTSSSAFVATPVDTIDTTLRGTQRVLDLALAKRVRSMVYLSSMEVYGAPDGSRRISESDFSGIDPMTVRNSYPESKRMAEALCAAYTAQHGVPATVLRLTQTFGPGLAADDSRVFAQFIRSALSGNDIVLHTTGASRRSMLYTADAVTAILTVMLRGDAGKAYNAANEGTYCSVREMAELVARTCGPKAVGVRVELGDAAGRGYAPRLEMDLDTSALRALGWRPTVDLEQMYRRTAASLRA